MERRRRDKRQADVLITFSNLGEELSHVDSCIHTFLSSPS
jgi:hypothetical protein